MAQIFNEVNLEKSWEYHNIKYRVLYTFATLANDTPVINCSLFKDGHVQHNDAVFVDSNCDTYEPIDWSFISKDAGNSLYLSLRKRGFKRV